MFQRLNHAQRILWMMVLVLTLSAFYSRAEQPLFEEDWDSLSRHETPEWFIDAKFGIYTHWGVYSVPAFKTEWYPHGMYMKEGFRNTDFYWHHVKNWGPPEKFGYKDFIPMFTGAKFDAEEWTELFYQAGARFAGPVAEHHDGFAMWDSALTKWDAKDMGPKQDIAGELEKSIRKRGMHFITSFHHARVWNYYPHVGDFDTNDPKYAYQGSMYGPIHGPKDSPTKEFLEDWEARVVEVIDKYDPDLLWFDGDWGGNPLEPYRKSMITYYYNRAIKNGKEVGVTYKQEDLPEGAGIRDYERGRSETVTKETWLTDLSIYKNSWGYIKGLEYYSADYLIDELIDIVSKNGCMLLNVGPPPDGRILEEDREILLAMGAWLKTNGEAIYSTRPWKVAAEGPTYVKGGARVRRKVDYVGQDIRFTKKGNAVYAIAMADPGETMKITSLGLDAGLLDGDIASVSVLGSEAKVEYTHSKEALTVTMPKLDEEQFAYVVKVTTR